MSPFAVIKDFNVFEDTGSGSLNGSVLLGIDQLDLEPAAERLHYRRQVRPAPVFTPGASRSTQQPFLGTHSPSGLHAVHA